MAKFDKSAGLKLWEEIVNEHDVKEEWFNDFAVEKLLKKISATEQEIERMKIAMLWRIAQALEEIWKKL
jgi:hypothetical protein